MRVDGVGSNGAAASTTTNMMTSSNPSFGDLLSAQGGDDVSSLLDIVGLLLGLLEGEAGDSDEGSSPLASAISALATSVSALAESINSNEQVQAEVVIPPVGQQPPPQLPAVPDDLDGDGEVTVFEFVDAHKMRMANIQSTAKTPLDYIAGGRQISL